MVAEHIPLSPAQRRQVDEFDDPSHELRRLFSELFGTFLLVIAAAGASMVDELTHGGVGTAAAVTAPGLMVMAIILFMGTNSGAHLNPVVTIAFALRSDFRWRRVPGYVVAQFLGSIAAAAVLRAILGAGSRGGITAIGAHFSSWQGFAVETIVTLGLVSTILGAASGAQNVGALAAIAAGGYIVLAGLWAGPVSGASMNPARSFGPALIAGDFSDLWVYIAGPVLGALLAVGIAFLLRGRGGGAVASRAAEGTD